MSNILKKSKSLEFDAIWDNYIIQAVPVSEARQQLYKSRVRQFILWLRGKQIKKAKDITLSIQREYIAFLLSAPGVTQGEHIRCLRRIFEISEIRIFQNVKIPRGPSIPHEIFSESEIALIRKHVKGYLRDIFMTGLYTGLRKKDICLLKKSEVNLEKWEISLKMNKTQKMVQVPVLKPLRDYLRSAIARSRNDYVFPALAEIYQDKPCRITHNFIYLLRRIGIQNIRQNDSRRHCSANLKGIHSLRHTFAYLAGKSGVSAYILQATLGHSSAKMTEHYLKHATEEDKRRCLKQIEDYLEHLK